MPNQTPNLTHLARDRRRRQTDPERLLWSKLRGRRLGGWKFRRQMPIGGYIVDFCCPDAWLIIELDGGQHTFDAAIARDLTRSRELELRLFRAALLERRCAREPGRDLRDHPQCSAGQGMNPSLEGREG